MEQTKPSYSSSRMTLNRYTNKHATDWDYYGGRGINQAAIWSRIHKLGWSVEEAVHGKEKPRTNSRPNN